MKRYSIFIIFGFLIISAFLLCVSGIENEIPSPEISSLLFSNTEMAPLLIPKIARAREEDKGYTDNLRKYKRMEIGARYYMNLPVNYLEDMAREKEMSLQGKNLFFSKNKAKWIGDYLISSFYPDEQSIMHSISRLRLKPLDLNTHLLAYGGAYIYPLAATIKLSSILGIVRLNADRVFNMLNTANMQKIFIIGKLFGIISFLFSILLIYFIGKSLCGSKFIGALSAVFLAFNPAAIVMSHFMKPWIFSIFWVNLSLYFVSKIKDENTKNNIVLYILSGIAAGFALGSVFPAGYIFLALILSHIYANKMKNFSWLIFAFFAFLLTYIVINPYHLISFRESLDIFRYTKETMLKNISFFDLHDHIINFFEISYCFGGLFLISIVCGIIISALERKKEDIVLLCCLFAYYIVNYKVISGNYPATLHVRYTYIIPLLPVLIIIGARFLQRVYEWCHKGIFALLIVIFVIMDSFGCSLFYAKQIRTTPKKESGSWINKNIPSGSLIGSWIQIDGHRMGYPPYNYLNYRLINDSDKNLSKIIKAMPEYYLAISIPYIREPFYDNTKLMRSYQAVKVFKNNDSFLSKIYTNKLLFFWVEEIKVFRKI